MVTVALAAIVVIATVVLIQIQLDIAKFKDEVGTVSSAITAVAVLVGGAFAIFRFQLFRDLEPHLSVSQEVSHRRVGTQYLHIAVYSVLSNNSKVRVEAARRFCRIQQILPSTDEEVEELYAQVFFDQEYDDIQWPTSAEFQRTSTEVKLVIEPGESLQETFEFLLPSDLESVLVFTYVYNSRYSDGSKSAEGWGATTIHDMMGS